MDFSNINWWAVLVCAFINMAIGGTWFSPKTFFSTWWEAIGKSKDETPGGANMGMIWGGTVVSSLLESTFMYWMVNSTGSMNGGATWSSGAMMGFILWLGFVAPSSLTNKLFADQPKAWILETGNHLVSFLVMGAISGAWH